MPEKSAAHVGISLVELTISGGEMLSDELTKRIGADLDRLEDMADGGVLTIRISRDADARRSLRPSDIDIRVVNRWERVLRRIERMSALTLVLAEGDCSGIALELLLVADYRVATADLAIHWKAPDGVPWPGMALYRLAHQAGYARARRLLLREAPLTAEVALDYGIVDEVCAACLSATGRLTARLDTMARGELAMRRRLLQDSLSTSYEEALGVHLAACDRVLRRERGDGDASHDCISPQVTPDRLS